jgi:hypothetical protein
MSDRITGFIRLCKPERGWGICNSYSVDKVLSKYFVHSSNFRSPTTLASGMQVSFVIGAPRSVGELPTALEIAIVPKTETAPVVTPAVGKGGAL